MCETCPAHIPGPGEVAGGALGLAVGAAMSKPGRRVLFWGLAVPLLPFAVVGVFGWWTIALAAVAAGFAAAGAVIVRKLHRHALVVAPPSLRHRVALPAAQPRRAITRKRQALPAGQGPTVVGTPVATYNKTAGKLGVVTGKVVPAPAGGKMKR
jgi:hypothetical protein